MGLHDNAEKDWNFKGRRAYNSRHAILPDDLVRLDDLEAAIAGLGTAYSFTDGLTLGVGNVVHGDYITGKSGGNTWSGGLAPGEGLTIDASKDTVKGPMRFNASRWGFNAGAVSPTMVDVDLTQSFAQDNFTTLDAFQIRGSTIDFTADASINTCNRVAYVSIGAPTFNNDVGDNDITPNLGGGGIATVWIEGAPNLVGWDDTNDAFSLFVESGDVLFGGSAYISGIGSNLFFRGAGGHQIGEQGGGGLTIYCGGGGGTVSLGTAGSVQVPYNSSSVGFSVLPAGSHHFQVHTTQTVVFGVSATLDAVYFDPSTTTISGSGTISTAGGFNQVTFAAPTYNGTATITHGANVVIGGEPGGTASITNKSALWVQSGTTRLAGTVIIQTLTGMLKGTSGTVGTATAGTDYQAPLSAADTTINFPTSTTIKVGVLPSKFIVQGTSDAQLSNAQFLGALSTGIVKNTTSTGVISIATAGTDYEPGLTFSTGLTRATNTITANLSTGVSGGQTATGGLSSGDLTLRSNTSNNGRILNGAWFALDEVNSRVLIGTQTAGAGAPLTIASSDGNSIGIALTQAAQQNIWKTNGDLGVGTGDNHYVALSTNNVARVYANGAGQQAHTNRITIGSLTVGVGVAYRFDQTIAQATSATLDNILFDSSTITVTGTGSITTSAGLNQVTFQAPTFTAGSAVTATNAATVAISGAPGVAGSMAITNPYALNVLAGTTRLAGTVIIGTLTGMLKGTSGTVSVATAGTDYAGIVTLTAGAGLTGGGDTSTNRTFDVVANADGSIVVNANDIQVGVINDTQHGSRGGGTLHAAATTSTAGFLSSADKSTLANSKFFVGNSTNAPASSQNLGALTTGLLKHTVSGAVSTIATATAGTDYENPLTFSTPGNTRTANNVTADYITGKAGNQAWIGGTASTDTLSISASSAASTGLFTLTGSRFKFTLPAPGSNNTASTEFVGFDHDLSRTSTWATGALTTQREALFRAPTYAFAGASTITTAATVAITGAPIPGTNATITNPAALWLQNGSLLLSGADAGSRAIRLTQAAQQNISKTGGTLVLATEDNQVVALSTSNTARVWVTGGGIVGIGTTSPLSTSQMHVDISQNAVTEIFTTNANTGGAAAASMIVGADPTSDSSKTLAMHFLGTSWTTSGILSAQAGLINHKPTNGAPLIFNQGGTGDMVWSTTSSFTERARLNNAGQLAIGSSILSGLDILSVKASSSFDSMEFETQVAAINDSSQRIYFNVFGGGAAVANGVNATKWIGCQVSPIVFSRAGAGTTPIVQEASTFVVSGEPTFSGTFTKTHVYAMHVGPGVGRFDGGSAFEDSRVVWEIQACTPDIIGSTGQYIAVRVTGGAIRFIELLSGT